MQQIFISAQSRNTISCNRAACSFKLKYVFCRAMSFVPTNIATVGVMQVHTWKYCGTEFDIKWHVKTHERVVHSDLKTKSVVIERRVLF